MASELCFWGSAEPEDEPATASVVASISGSSSRSFFLCLDFFFFLKISTKRLQFFSSICGRNDNKLTFWCLRQKHLWVSRNLQPQNRTRTSFLLLTQRWRLCLLHRTKQKIIREIEWKSENFRIFTSIRFAKQNKEWFEIRSIKTNQVNPKFSSNEIAHFCQVFQ